MTTPWVPNNPKSITDAVLQAIKSTAPDESRVAGLVAWLVANPDAPVKNPPPVTWVAVIPDSQNESPAASFARAKWINANYGFAAAIQVGDITNWGVRDESQFIEAQQWMELINCPRKAVAIGNHDTAAVKVGGSAYDPPNTHILLRDTRVFNKYHLASTPAKARFEDGKLDNVWHRINDEWIVITLEMWPRKEAIAWANEIIKARPGTKFIINTHAGLDKLGAISDYKGYGSTSPAYLRDILCRPNPNVRIVLCGHTGTTAVVKDAHVYWMLNNETEPGKVRVLKLQSDNVETWLENTYTKPTP